MEGGEGDEGCRGRRRCFGCFLFEKKRGTRASDSVNGMISKGKNNAFSLILLPDQSQSTRCRDRTHVQKRPARRETRGRRRRCCKRGMCFFFVGFLFVSIPNRFFCNVILFRARCTHTALSFSRSWQESDRTLSLSRVKTHSETEGRPAEEG